LSLPSSRIAGATPTAQAFSGPGGRLLGVAAVLIVAGIIALAGWMSWDSRRVVWSHAVQSAENLAALLEHDIKRNIESYDLSLQSVVDGLKVEGIRTMPPDIRDMILFDRAATAQYLGSINVIDETGAIIIDSTSVEPRPGNLKDREYFTAHRDRSDVGLFISGPFISRFDKVPEIGLSRRLAHADGSFAGVVVGTLQLQFFQQLFNSLDLGADDNITLLNANRQIIVRKLPEWDTADNVPGFTALFARYPSERMGVFELTAVRDGIPRFYAYRQIGDFPLILSIGLSERSIFAEWWQKTATIALGVAILTSLAAGFGILCLVELRRRGLAEAAARDNERRYRLLAENSTDMIVRASLEGVRRYVSPACRSLYGYEPEELVGTRALDFTHPEDRNHMPLATARLLAGDEKVVSSYRARRKDGSYIWVEASRKLVNDPEAEEPEFVVVVRDFQARKEIEAELEAARLRAEAANDAKSRFLANMSHELRTPLNAVIGFSDLMAREIFGPLGSDKYRIYATDIRASGEHLLELINEVLDHAKAESGHLQINEEVVPIGGLIEFAVRMLAPRAEHAGVAIRSNVSVGVNAVRGDERRLKQILLNLVTNAIKFTPSGGEVAVSAGLAASGELTIAVKDTGVGIAEEEQAKIFEPFMQAAPAKATASEGTGLGLPLTKRLVELHSGSLELMSNVGIGTTIVVRLPAARVIGPPQPVGPEERQAPTVLVVDDDAPVLRTAVTMLKRMGVTTLVAANANEALVHLQRGTRIDLLFTDIVMPPGMNGVELAEQARKLHPEMKILLTSGFAGHAVVYDSSLGGGQAIIQKPYGFADLRSAMEAQLGRLDRPMPVARREVTG
jgi:PAS domain S-box-containing protein